MKLYDNPASPFCRKVLVMVRELGVLDSIEIAQAVGTALNPSKMPTEQNPLGKIPTLVTDEGQPLFDSRVICRFLNDQNGGAMYPEDRHWSVLQHEALADGVMDAAILMVYEKRCRPEEIWSSDWIEGQWQKVTRALDHLEALPLSEGFTADHIATACALGYLDFRHSDRDWRNGRPTLTAWFAEVSMRESLKETEPSA